MWPTYVLTVCAESNANETFWLTVLPGTGAHTCALANTHMQAQQVLGGAAGAPARPASRPSSQQPELGTPADGGHAKESRSKEKRRCVDTQAIAQARPHSHGLSTRSKQSL